MDDLSENIAEQINSGYVTIDSFEDFEKLLKRFPNDPALQRASADLMLKNNLPDEAALSYSKAASLFLKSGNLLSAIFAIRYSWRIKSPSYQEAKLFLTAARDNNFPSTPLKIFFENLSNPEVISVIKSFEDIHLPEQKSIQNIDDLQNSLNFVVSGDLKEIRYCPVKTKEETVYKQSIVNLSAEDSIGDLYPIDEEKVSQSYIVTVTPVELLRLSKQTLLQLCRNYPNVESGLQSISAFRSECRKENRIKKNRRDINPQFGRKITIEIHPQSSDNFPIIIEGYSTDFSIGGTCVVLDANDVGVIKSVASFSRKIKNSKVKISFPTEGLELKVSGKIAWTKEVEFQHEKTLALGVQFQNLSPKLRGMLYVFAESSKRK